MLSTPVSGVEIRNEVVAALEAPLRRRPRAAGMTPHEQRGRGAPKSAALTVAPGPEPPRCSASNWLGISTFIMPATVKPSINQGADSINRAAKFSNNSKVLAPFLLGAVRTKLTNRYQGYSLVVSFGFV